MLTIQLSPITSRCVIILYFATIIYVSENVLYVKHQTSAAHWYFVRSPNSWSTWPDWQSPGPLQAAVHLTQANAEKDLIKDLSRPAAASHLIHYMATAPHTSMQCSQMFQMVRDVGINGAYAVLPMFRWHDLSQVIGQLMLSDMKYSKRDVFNTLSQLSMAAVQSKQTVNAAGIVHGAAWYIAAKTPSPLAWDVILSWGVEVELNFLHGLGHGIFIKHAPLQTYTACSPHPLLVTEDDYSVYEAGLTFCKHAPDMFVGITTAQGLHHAWSEYAFVRRNYQWSRTYDQSWLHPCPQISFPLWCFAWIFLSGIGHVPPASHNYVPNNTRFRNSLLHEGHVSLICSGDEWSAAASTDCVAGLSFFAFPYFDALQNEAGSLSLLAKCLRLPRLAFFIPNIHCEWILDKPITRASAKQSNSSLMEWCSFFIKAPEQDQFELNDLHRWMACISGSLSHFMLFPNAEQERARLCQHDLSWQSGEIWDGSRHLCSSEQGFGFGFYQQLELNPFR